VKIVTAAGRKFDVEIGAKLCGMRIVEFTMTAEELQKAVRRHGSSLVYSWLFQHLYLTFPPVASDPNRIIP